MPIFLVGLDLGQAADFSALCLLERAETSPATYLLRHAQRFPLATLYPEIVERVARRLLEPPLQGRTMLAVDASGVGPPVLELFRARLPRTPVVGITITGGASVGGDSSNPTVPKRDLVSTLAVVFQTQRIRIAPAAIAAGELGRSCSRSGSRSPTPATTPTPPTASATTTTSSAPSPWPAGWARTGPPVGCAATSRAGASRSSTPTSTCGCAVTTAGDREPPPPARARPSLRRGPEEHD